MDWDECLQPLIPKISWSLIREKQWYKNTLPSFQDYFEQFRETEDPEFYGYKNLHEKVANFLKTYNGNDEFEANKKDHEKFKESIKESFFAIFQSPDLCEKAGFLSVGEDIIKAYEEELIGSLIIISSTFKEEVGSDARKPKMFEKTFKKFPNSSLHINPYRFFTKTGKHRWQQLKEDHPDFDIFIDDNPNIIKESAENLPADKVFALCDYKCNRGIAKGDNIYNCPNSTSKIEIKDFERVAEILNKKKEKKLDKTKNKYMSDNNDDNKDNSKSEKPKWYDFKSTLGKVLWIGVPILLLLIGGGLAYYLIKRKKSQKEDEANKEAS